MKKPSYSAMLSVATAAYSVYALANPRHIGKALTASPLKQPDYDIAARTFGVRDLVISSLALAAPTAAAREQAMMGRVAFDLTDSALFSNEATTSGRKAKVLAVTVSWAALNAAAIIADRRR